ncbi:serine/threonine-protein kinase STY46-like isoform X6 [Carica papaya]|uniref:serine/threonine-protein kinase STY46-like isoform X6 n=1 Tax=Carica papaya TaxID=3649 RepID=UPI000B8C8671|nr:serine/threonine-protein kinase STY46-like isoform X6 [Carica papaya]
MPSHKSTRDYAIDFEPCSKLEDLNLNVRKNVKDTEEINLIDISKRQDILQVPIHEVIFSTVDKPKLLSQFWFCISNIQLSALLSDIGLNIREAHVFSTTDGYSLDVFVVDGWPIEDTDDLYKAMEKAIGRSEGSWSGSSHSAGNKTSVTDIKSRDWEIDRRLLKIGERIASGSCGDLYRGVYLGQDVAIKILRSEHLNEAIKDEFAQEVAILREVQHKNVVRFIGACTKAPHLCIVTEDIDKKEGEGVVSKEERARRKGLRFDVAYKLRMNEISCARNQERNGFKRVIEHLILPLLSQSQKEMQFC